MGGKEVRKGGKEVRVRKEIRREGGGGGNRFKFLMYLH